MNVTCFAIGPTLALGFVTLTSCEVSPADAAVNAATSNMGPVKSAAVRNATGHGTGPVEQAKDDVSDKIEDIKN